MEPTQEKDWNEVRTVRLLEVQFLKMSILRLCGAKATFTKVP